MAKKSLQGLHPTTDLELVSGVGRDVLVEHEWVIGLDEVGMGCLAGPVVAGCFAWRLPSHQAPHWSDRPLITDSKKLSESQRTLARAWLVSRPEEDSLHALAHATPLEIDEINILRAAQLAMERAFATVWERIGARSARVFIDGNKVPKFLTEPGRPWTSHIVAECLVKGDSRSFAIAGASILAKDSRDLWMKQLDGEFPGYGWSTNVGYPTIEHKQAIQSNGFTPWHRRSFRAEL